MIFFRDEFRSIHKVNSSFTEAQITWNNNWVTFLDGILQLHTLRDGHETVSLPYKLRRLSISIREHFNNKVVTVDGKSVIVANIFVKDFMTRCGGVLIEDIQYRKLPVYEEENITLKTLQFVPRSLSNSDVSRHDF